MRSTDTSGLYAERLRLAKSDEHIIRRKSSQAAPPFAATSMRHRQVDAHFAPVPPGSLSADHDRWPWRVRNRTGGAARRNSHYGEQLGLTKDWAYRIIKQVGNYGEVFEKNVGQGSQLKIARGVNALWTKGGLQYAPPIR